MREFFFARTVEKWKQNGDIEEREREKNKSGTSFHLILLLISVAHCIGHGHEHRAAGNDYNNDDNYYKSTGKKNVFSLNT